MKHGIPIKITMISIFVTCSLNRIMKYLQIVALRKVGIKEGERVERAKREQMDVSDLYSHVPDSYD